MKRALTSVLLSFLLLTIPTVTAVQQSPNQTPNEPISAGSYYAVIAACTRWQNSSFNVPKLTPYTDRALSQTYNGLLQGKNWQPDHITLLLNEQATKANITTALQTMANTLGPDDYFLFQWCGHGTHVNDTDGDEAQHTPGDTTDEGICPYDIIKHGEGNFTNLITDDELGCLFSNITCKGMVLLFDCCLSGSLIDATNQTNQTQPLSSLAMTAQGPNSLDVNGTNRIVIMATPPDHLERGTHFLGYELNTALGIACQLQTTIHHNTTITAEKIFRTAKPIFNAESAIFWVGCWILFYFVDGLTRSLINDPLLLSITATLDILFTFFILEFVYPQVYGHPIRNQANICDDYPGDFPLLIT